MPRRNRPHRPGPTGPSRPAGSGVGGSGGGTGGPTPLSGGWLREEEDARGAFLVRSVSGSAAAKPYRCPGCDQLITPGTPHVVAWPSDEPVGSVERRHWHSDCWRRRR